jgi:hypothetical protein
MGIGIARQPHRTQRRHSTQVVLHAEAIEAGGFATRTHDPQVEGDLTLALAHPVENPILEIKVVRRLFELKRRGQQRIRLVFGFQNFGPD